MLSLGGGGGGGGRGGGAGGSLSFPVGVADGVLTGSSSVGTIIDVGVSLEDVEDENSVVVLASAVSLPNGARSTTRRGRC